MDTTLTTIGECINCNPSVKLDKGKIYPIIDIEKIVVGRKFVTSKDSIVFSNQSGAKFENGDTLMARITPCLENGKIAKVQIAGKGIGSTELFVFRGKDGISDNDFVYYLFNQQYIRVLSANSMTGASGRQRADLKFIKRIKISLPSLPLQRKIASILSAYDSLIENNTKRIRLLEQMAENLYKEWFVRFRFPGYENTEFVNGLPKCWSVKKYGEIAEIVAGGDCPCICSDIPTDDLCVPIYSNGVTNEGLYGYTNKERISKPCITISARGTIGYVCLRTIPFVPIVRLLAVVPKNISVYYLFHYSRHNYLEGNGTSQQQLTKPMLQKRKVLVPAESTLLKFDMNVENIYNQKRKLEKINNTLTRQRDLLLPRLMSGKLEVKA